MKKNQKSFLFKLIITICLITSLVNISGKSTVYAAEDTWGGVLIKPIVKLVTALSDGVMDILHNNIQQQDTAFIQIKGGDTGWKKWGRSYYWYYFGSSRSNSSDSLYASHNLSGIGVSGHC